MIHTPSFRDPGGTLAISEGRVTRALTDDGARAWRDLVESGLFAKLRAAGKLVETREQSERVLEHAALPISYAYEWPVALLKEAAVLQLEILEEALGHGMTLKDGGAENVLFDGVTPTFVDVLSLQKRKDGDPWAGYGEFCGTLLYPLMLAAYKGLPHHLLLRGRATGLTAAEASGLFGFFDNFRPGVLAHVRARAGLERRFEDSRVDRDEVRSGGLPVESVLHFAGSLRRLVERLDVRPAGHWAGYEDQGVYSGEQAETKERFVARCAESLKPALVWDAGCNAGRYTLAAAPHSRRVIGFDSDAAAVGRLVDRCRETGVRNVLPLICDVADPSPSQGWDGRQRLSLLERGRPDLLMCLALVHHLAVSAAVPLREQLTAFARWGRRAIIEFVDREDAMFRRISKNTDNPYRGYGREAFLAEVDARFDRLESLRLSPTREIFLLKSRIE